MKIKFHITETKNPASDDSLSGKIKTSYLSSPFRPYELVDDRNSADFIVFWEDYEESEQSINSKLRKEAEAIGDLNKVFVVSSEDRPSGFLPGVYTGTPICPWRQNRFLTGAYFWTMNPFLEAGNKESIGDPKYLYSFRGALTSPVRRNIVSFHASGSHCRIEETENLKFTTNVECPSKSSGQLDYRELILDSKFVLCPRGGGDSSYRLFVSMQLGRVPVILSDRWTPPLGPSWGELSIRIAENKVHMIEPILRDFESQAEVMGRNARKAWENWFSPDILPLRTLQWIHHLALTRTHNESSFQKLWPLIEWLSGNPSPVALRAYSKIARTLRSKDNLFSHFIQEI